MKDNTIYDVAGVGIGPFNLGMAALASSVEGFSSIFFDSKPSFSWHPGLMFDFATLQVPFLADLVTAAEPWNRFSFLSYLKQCGRLYQFANLDDNYVTRKEYNRYCCWVAGQLDNLHFGQEVQFIHFKEAEQLYEVVTQSNKGPQSFFARHIVVGVGLQPNLSSDLYNKVEGMVIHSGEYLHWRENISNSDSITVVGSGQSAAEIIYDLLSHRPTGLKQLNWLTKTDRFYAMETSKLCHEMTSADYIDYFYELSSDVKQHVLRRQDSIYKGINQELIAAIYRLLYDIDIEDDLKVKILTNIMVEHISSHTQGVTLDLRELAQGKSFTIESDVVILATGYRCAIPGFIDPIRERVQFDECGRFKADRHYSIGKKAPDIFIQNGELHSHGFNASDLGMGAYRNSVILNRILGYDYFKVEDKMTFQTFGV